jgi:hypothetical protein
MGMLLSIMFCTVQVPQVLLPSTVINPSCPTSKGSQPHLQLLLVWLLLWSTGCKLASDQLMGAGHGGCGVAG